MQPGVLKPNVQREITSPGGEQGLMRAGGWGTCQLTQGRWSSPSLQCFHGNLLKLRRKGGPCWTREEMEATVGEGVVLTTGDHSTRAAVWVP